MVSNEHWMNRIRERLMHLPDVEEKKMFSGTTFMVNSKMCIGVTRNGIMYRIDPELHETLVERTGCQTMTMKNRKLKGYVLVDETGMRTESELDYWVGLALDFNERAKASPKKKKKSD